MIELERAIELAKQQNASFDVWKEYKTLYVFSQNNVDKEDLVDPVIVLKHNGEFRAFSGWSVKYPETLSMAQYIKTGAC